MNLFQLDPDAKKCAEYHQDAHLRVCPKEAVQALCAAFPVPHEAVRVAWAACRPLGRLAAGAMGISRKTAYKWTKVSS